VNSAETSTRRSERSTGVLHLVDPGSPAGGPCTLRLLGDLLESRAATGDGAACDVALVGNAAHLDLAQRCGVRPRYHLRAALNAPLLALGELRRILRRADPHYATIHAWSPATVVLAAFAGGDLERGAYLTMPPAPGLETRLFRRAQRRACRIAAPDVATLNAIASRGVPSARLRVVPPAIRTRLLAQAAVARRRWGVDDSAFVVGLLTGPPDRLDAGAVVRLIDRIAFTGRPMKLLLDPRTGRRLDAQRWARSMITSSEIIVDDAVAEPWRILAGVDAALFVNPSRIRTSSHVAAADAPIDPLPLPWAMAAGSAIVAQSGAVSEQLIEHGRTGLLFPADDFNGASELLARVYDDREAARGLGEAARNAALDRCELEVFRREVIG
jgi:glycosyltransferase involved in cell wall biosynthesis